MVKGFAETKGTPTGDLAVADQFQRNLQRQATWLNRQGDVTNAERFGHFAEKVRNNTMPIPARELSQANKFEQDAIKAEHAIRNKKFKETDKAIPKGATKEIMPWTHGVTAAAIAAPIGSLLGPVGSAASGLIPLIATAISRSNFKGNVKRAPDVAKYLMGKDVPDMPKMSAADKKLLASKGLLGLMSGAR